jgi:cytochrome c oxidase cbb3-type subunit I/II
MPRYPWLYDQYFDQDIIPAKIRAMRKLGVPYEEGYDDQAVDDLQQQADEIVAQLKV